MTEFLNMLDSEIERMKNQINALSDARKDEANLIRVRMNIFDVCRTVHGALLRKHAPEEFGAAYLAKLAEFEAAWRKSQDMAETHGDTEKAVIEQIKLEALVCIREKFEQGNEADA